MTAAQWWGEWEGTEVRHWGALPESPLHHKGLSCFYGHAFKVVWQYMCWQLKWHKSFSLVYIASLCGSKNVMANDTLVFTLVHFTSDKVSVILTVNLTDNKIYFYNIISSTLHVLMFTSCPWWSTLTVCSAWCWTTSDVHLPSSSSSVSLTTSRKITALTPTLSMPGRVTGLSLY